MATTAEAVPAAAESGRKRYSRVVFTALAWLLVVSVLVQVFLAGLIVFESGEYIEDHQTFVHFFEFVPWIMLLLVFIGGLGRSLAIHSFVLAILIGLQYAFAEAENGNIGALHTVNALLIFWLAIATALRVTRQMRSKT
jgi:hypothetical protein